MIEMLSKSLICGTALALCAASPAWAQSSAVNALLEQARYWQERGQQSRATEAYRRVLDVDPDNAEAKRALSRRQSSPAPPPAPAAKPVRESAALALLRQHRRPRPIVPPQASGLARSEPPVSKRSQIPICRVPSAASMPPWRLRPMMPIRWAASASSPFAEGSSPAHAICCPVPRADAMPPAGATRWHRPASMPKARTHADCWPVVRQGRPQSSPSGWWPQDKATKRLPMAFLPIFMKHRTAMPRRRAPRGRHWPCRESPRICRAS